MNEAGENLRNWNAVLDEVRAELEDWGSPCVPPATDEMIAAMRMRAAASGLIVNDEYVAFLKTSNGLSWAGISLCGIDPGTFETSAFAGEDFFRLNTSVEYRPGDTLYGIENEAHIVGSGSDGKFRTIDAGGDAVFDESDSLLDLFTRLCRRSLAEIEEPDSPEAIAAADL